MHRVVKIEHHVIWQAWHNWYNFHHGLRCEEVEERFFDFVHPSREDSFIDEIIDWDDDEEYYYLLPNTVDRLNMLTSPHHAAFIKTYYINHPWK